MAMIVALVIGIAFGWTLERAGLGSARKLSGQFDLTDFTVMKVMFTAIVVAMTGAFWLGRLGAIDLANVFVPDTFLLPQIAGGAIFGVGFLIAGLCPGTSCVSAATGRGDGLAAMAGMFAGVLVTGIAFAPLQHFYESSSFGAWTIPQMLHVPYGVIVAAIIAGAFVFSRGVPAAARWALPVIAVATALAGDPVTTRYIDPLQLASWIHDRRPGLEILDSRPAADFDRVHVPGAKHVDASEASIVVRAGGYSYVLRGGIDGWINDVLSAKRPTPLTRYFGGPRWHGC